MTDLFLYVPTLLLECKYTKNQRIKQISNLKKTYKSRVWGQAESTVHMLNWAIRSVKFLGVEFDQSEDEEVSVSDTTHL